MIPYALEYPAVMKVAVMSNDGVGRQLCVLMKRAGHHVTGFDLCIEHVSGNCSAKSNFDPTEDTELEGIAFTNNPIHIRENDVYVICSKSNTGDLKFVFSAKQIIKAHAKPGALIILESSVGVGDTRRVFHDEWTVGMLVAYSPERIPDIPKVVGGVDPQSTLAACSFYSTVFSAVLPMHSSEQAEAIKLIEDSYRARNTPFINGVAVFADTANYSMMPVAGYECTGSFCPTYSYNVHVGSHCFTPGPNYAFAGVDSMNARSSEKAKEADSAKEIRRVLVCGVSCKPDAADIKNAKQMDFVRTLEEIDIKVEFFDPLVHEFGGLERIEDLSGVNGYDKVFVFHQHSICKEELEKLRPLPHVDFYC